MACSDTEVDRQAIRPSHELGVIRLRYNPDQNEQSIIRIQNINKQIEISFCLVCNIKLYFAFPEANCHTEKKLCLYFFIFIVR